MKNLPWDHEKDSETVWHTVKPWELRGLKKYVYVYLFVIYVFVFCDDKK